MTGSRDNEERERFESDNETVERDDDSSASDEVVPMKGESTSEDEMSDEESTEQAKQEDDKPGQEGDSDDSQSDDSENDDADHDASDVYRPTEGEDIYGNRIEKQSSETKPQKYVPPHLRKKQGDAKDAVDEARNQKMSEIRRALNTVLNRLSVDSVVSAAQSISRLYPSYPTSDINDCIWMNAK